MVTRVDKIKFITVLASAFAVRGGKFDERSTFGQGYGEDIRLDIFHLCVLKSFSFPVDALPKESG